MQPLAAIVQQLCTSLPGVDPAACQLLFEKKPLDLSTPARLSNLPAGAKVELRTELAPTATAASDLLGLGRQVHVFTREAAEAAEAEERAAGEASAPSDDFYEFTAEDWARVAAGRARAAAAAEGASLRTAALRERDERVAASRHGPAPVRVHLPGGLVLQASFGALETLGALRQLVARCLAPGVRSWTLYTAPPKQVLADWGVSMYKAGLVPAANVHLGLGAPHGGTRLLRPEVAALLGPPPPARGFARRQAPDAGQERSERTVAGGNFRAGGASGTSNGKAGGGKAPKWLKLGK
ncbi:hypothetical protein WJX81_000496 [Elliptochloris bilobata]|uniref:TUG ubiquitin-like domain-containing protein n=1 Tax=Elliptochloris bilobata TaxID=381761 RepID=A0AAW1S094_9CHLO